MVDEHPGIRATKENCSQAARPYTAVGHLRGDFGGMKVDGMIHHPVIHKGDVHGLTLPDVEDGPRHGVVEGPGLVAHAIRDLHG